MFRSASRHIAILMTLSLLSCTDEVVNKDREPIPDSPGTVTIRFSNSTSGRSKESDNSETLIENLIVALYPNTADESSTSPVVVERVSGRNDHTTSTVAMLLTEDMVVKLFNKTNGVTCRMYAVANLTDAEAAELPENPTIAQLKNCNISAMFDTKKEQSSFVMAGEGKVTFTAGSSSSDPGKASGNAELYRAAAKIILNINLPSSIEIGSGDNKESWEPEQGNIRVLLNRGVKKAVAAPVPAVGETAWHPGDAADTYFDSKPSVTESMRYLTQTGTGKFNYIMDVPLYTYPNLWTESVSETNKTTLTLMVPWRKSGTNTWNTYYYQVPVTPADLPHIDRNYSYNINLTVGMLGSLVPDTPLVLENLNYQVVNWSEETVNVNINDYRYLVVNPNVISIQNEAKFLVPFYSSHPVDISDISLTYERFNFYSNGNGEVVDITIPKEQIDKSTYTHTETVNGVATQVTDSICNYTIVKDPSTNQFALSIEHQLKTWTPVQSNGTTVALTGNNDGSLNTVTNRIDHYVRPTDPEDAYSAYRITVKIAHKDNASYSETITITQYPGMYITADRNPANATSGNLRSNVWINGSNTGSQDDYGVVSGFGSGNKNPNMYVITIGQLNTGSEYIIGDPRASEINNLNDGTYTDLTASNLNNATTTWCKSATALYDNQTTTTSWLGQTTTTAGRTLRYYYPTYESQGNQYKMCVAPKLRIASSYGKSLGAINRNTARRRIATYQEMNCPAGRWRLPTYGELLYIVQLSQTEKIPVLFNSGANYWTAQGRCTVNDDGTITLNTNISNNTTAYVRGVYDEWYWEQYPQYSIKPSGTNYSYTLGDMPRGAQ